MRALAERLLSATILLTWHSVHAATVIPITPPPDALSTMVFGINDSNVIAGSYVDANGVEHGFTGPLNGTYTIFDFGGTSVGTTARAIGNDGTINGFTTDPNYVLGEEFLRRPDGTIEPITKDGVPLDGIAQGVTSIPGVGGVITVGDYFDEDLNRLGYVARNGIHRRDIGVPFNDTSFRPRAINQDGTVAGYIQRTDGNHGFIMKNGRVQIIDADDTATTILEGFNNHELASGQVVDEAGNSHSFTYDHRTGEFRTIDLADGSAYQQAWGVNNARLVVVSTSDGMSYVYCPKRPDSGIL